jgi:hypothetical protein
MCQHTNPEMHPNISLDKCKQAFKTWQVGTSTSPLGRYLSHQHALFQPHGIDPCINPEAHHQAKEACGASWQAQHGIFAYAVQHGYCFDQWKHVVNAMIKKEPGNLQLHSYMNPATTHYWALRCNKSSTNAKIVKAYILARMVAAQKDKPPIQPLSKSCSTTMLQ